MRFSKIHNNDVVFYDRFKDPLRYFDAGVNELMN